MQPAAQALLSCSAHAEYVPQYAWLDLQQIVIICTSFINNFIEAVHCYYENHWRVFSDNQFKTTKLAE
jgi:hypothetical protein